MGPESVRRWLEALGLERYARTFADNDIGADVLPHLSELHLKELGVSLGDRVRLLRAIEGGSTPLAPAARRPGPPEPRAEHRQVTVMFCDLVGSTALSESLDLEEYREVLGAYQGAVGPAVERFDGYIARYMGDGVLGYFGYPRAHEDDAERAVRAALSIIAAVGRLPPVRGVALNVRIGIATGHVVAGDVVGEGAAAEHTVLGETPNLAARLQSLAPPGSVLISRRTHRLTGRLFAYEESGPHEVKGLSAPVTAWRVLGEGTSESRFAATRSPEESAPLVGRETELAVLLDRWNRALDREGQIVLLGGEPGIGKSRLTHALRQRTAAQARTLVQLQCSSHYANTALHPFIEELRRVAGFSGGDSNRAKLDKLEAWLAATMAGADDVAPLLARLLALPNEGRYPPIDLPPDREKDRIVEILLARLRAHTERAPLLLVAEDLHWADPTTLDVLGVIVDAAPTLPLLAVMTYRPEFVPPWAGRGHVTAHSLTRLGRRQVTQIVSALSGDTGLPGELLDEIAARTDGVPLFVEELTKAVLEARVAGAPQTGGGRGGTALVAVPSTLQDSLVARLDRLGSVKAIAQIASVIGREFSRELLAAIAPLEAAGLEDALARLEAAELVFRRGTPPDASYAFKHALVLDAAYDSLLKPHRRSLHRAVVRALEERFPEAVEREPEVVAYHAAAAGLAAQAVAYWQSAARSALARSAYAESIAHLRAALRMLATHSSLPAGQERELELRIALGGALIATRGYRTSETLEAFGEALPLARAVGDDRQVFTILRGLLGVHSVRAELGVALEVAGECLSIAERRGESGPLSLAHRLVGQTHCLRGELAAASVHLERALALDGGGGPPERAAVLLTGGGHRNVAPAFLAHVRWLQGFPDQALALASDALRDAEARDGAFSITASMFFLIWVHAWRREDDALRALVARQRALAERHGISEWAATGELLDALSRLGGDPDGAATATRWVESVRADGGLRAPIQLALLAQALVSYDAELAVGLVAEAHALTARTGERWSEAEILRIEASVRLLAGEPREHAVRCLERSIETAEGQGARAWTLRSATALARLTRGQARAPQARAFLAEVFEQFTEGPETADLRDARAVLDGNGR